MRKVLAIVTLSWKAAIRYKFLWVLVALLAGQKMGVAGRLVVGRPDRASGLD